MRLVVSCIVLTVAFFVGVFVSTSARLSEPVAGVLQLQAIARAVEHEQKAKTTDNPSEKVKLESAADFSMLSAKDSGGPSPLQKLAELVHALIGFLTALGAWFLRLAARFYEWLRGEIGMFSEDDDDSDLEDEDEEVEEEDISARLDKLESLIRQVAAVPSAPAVQGWPLPTQAPSVGPKPPATL